MCESFLSVGIGAGFAKQNRCCKAAKATKPSVKNLFFTLYTLMTDIVALRNICTLSNLSNPVYNKLNYIYLLDNAS